MIEVNKRAKPFHPCEELLGTELFFMMKRCQLIGRNYYAPQYPTDVKDVMCQVKQSLLVAGLHKTMKQYGFYERLTNPALSSFYQFLKKEGSLTIQVYVASHAWQYPEVARAQEICKYLQFFTAPGIPLNKELVIDISQLSTGEWGCKGVNGGTEVELFQLPQEPDEHIPPPPQWPAGHAHNAQAAMQVNIAVQGAGAIAGEANWAHGGIIDVVHHEAPAAPGGVFDGLLNQILGG